MTGFLLKVRFFPGKERTHKFSLETPQRHKTLEVQRQISRTWYEEILLVLEYSIKYLRKHKLTRILQHCIILTPWKRRIRLHPVTSFNFSKRTMGSHQPPPPSIFRQLIADIRQSTYSQLSHVDKSVTRNENRFGEDNDCPKMTVFSHGHPGTRSSSWMIESLH
jgi:hypothetical protein